MELCLSGMYSRCSPLLHMRNATSQMNGHYRKFPCHIYLCELSKAKPSTERCTSTRARDLDISILYHATQAGLGFLFFKKKNKTKQKNSGPPPRHSPGQTVVSKMDAYEHWTGCVRPTANQRKSRISARKRQLPHKAAAWLAIALAWIERACRTQ